MQFARLNGITLHYQTIGAPAGKPAVVFCNALGTDFRIWRDVIVRLAGECAIVCYDKRGHGLSDIGETPYGMDDHVSDLEALLDHLRLGRVIVCGLSVGGLIAQGLYARRPDLVRALVLCDTAHRIGTGETWNARIAEVEANGIASIADGVLENWFTPDFIAGNEAEFTGFRNMLARSPVDGYLATCAAIRDADYTREAGLIGVPTLCVVGDRDGSTPPDLVLELAKLIPAARYEVIADAGHLTCVEQPDSLVAVLCAFIAGFARTEADKQ